MQPTTAAAASTKMSLRNRSGLFLIQLLTLSVVLAQAQAFSIRKLRQTENTTRGAAITLQNMTNISKISENIYDTKDKQWVQNRKINDNIIDKINGNSLSVNTNQSVVNSSSDLSTPIKNDADDNGKSNTASKPATTLDTKLESIENNDRTSTFLTTLINETKTKNYEGSVTSDEAKPKTTSSRKKYISIQRTTTTETESETTSLSTTPVPLETTTVKQPDSIFSTSETNKPDTTTIKIDEPTTIIENTVWTDVSPIAIETSDTIKSNFEDDSAFLKVEPVNNANQTSKPEIVSSKRGGYLDNSVKQINSSVEETTTEGIKNLTTNKVKKMQDIDIRNMYDASQNQMIEEALLAEKLISDTEQIGNYNTDTFSNSQSSSEEKLETKSSINRNNSIYTVNPNYKPLKKLEVSPPKPYHKHPDDNSWRNQSISQNLGIVFNPKNSTKPLTQVLKIKTETELFTEKEVTSTEAPDLRDRLAKLAGSRRTKMNKTSSGDTNTTNGDDDDVLTWHKNIFENYEDVTVKTDLSSPLSKEQQRILHDYENEEYNEADYFSLANVEINKRAQKKSKSQKNQHRNKLASISDVDYAIATGQFQPHRKPTVQYFPPRTPEKTKKKPQSNDDDYAEVYKPTYKPAIVNIFEMHPRVKDTENNHAPLRSIKDSESMYKVKGISDVEYPKYKQYDDGPVDSFRKDMPSFLENADAGDTDKDYPVVYKTAVLHENPERNANLLASSAASMRQVYQGGDVTSIAPSTEELPHLSQGKTYLQESDYNIDIQPSKEYLSNVQKTKDVFVSIGQNRPYISSEKDIGSTDYALQYYIPQDQAEDEEMGGTLPFL